jgi:hypothetical protein
MVQEGPRSSKGEPSKTDELRHGKWLKKVSNNWLIAPLLFISFVAGGTLNS